MTAAAAAAAVRVPMRVEYAGTWLSWVGATTGCLRALGVACDVVDVAGQGGYAFQLTVHPTLCPSGPTMFDWAALNRGPWRLGRSTVAFTAPEPHETGHRSERTTAHCRAAMEFARREVEAGRPCVVWGPYLPEFAIVVGVDGEHYAVESFKSAMREPQPPVRFDELEAAGGLYVLGFPTPTAPDRETSDRAAVDDAARLLARNERRDGYGQGLAAYDVWVAAMKEGTAEPFGNGYNAACWADARHLAGRFIDRLAGRTPAVAEPLAQAHAALVRSAEALGRVAKLFPFPGSKDHLTPSNRDAAADALRAAQAADRDAAAALAEATTAWPRPTTQPTGA